ncbi:hypothetical protein B0H67DRAFT_257943 [Lasiosphaeris hirsuta]|uniref:Uncharacterized protein n=1 Tax=Lasiosphaeris hirsuta TaxID=260670 RepID=A0AA40AHX5_9PEZI|nr:hypothetical protein B0H67DRAFT_257943 [Lasiosphaeris hirsuta]
MPTWHRDRIDTVVFSKSTLIAGGLGNTWLGGFTSPNDPGAELRPSRQLPTTDTDTDAETESGLSIASSTSATSFDADSLEALFLILIDDGNLQYLWPQLVHIAGAARSKQVIQGFVKQYGDNLYREAASALELSTSHFVRGHAATIAARISLAFIRETDSFSAANKAKDREENIEGEPPPTADLVYLNPDIRLVEAFLFESGAYLALQASVESYVQTCSVLAPGICNVGDSLRLGLQLFMAKCGLNKLPAVKPGTTRLKFTCNHCSLPIYDDYRELLPGGLERLQSLLGRLSHRSHTPRARHRIARPQTRKQRQPLRLPRDSRQHPSRHVSQRPSLRLPTSQAPLPPALPALYALGHQAAPDRGVPGELGPRLLPTA